ncbi:MAG: hypothetical protein KatS3mg009_0395 [Acidimicrobiia bacterium]|nr:MAG: hypothetical protein KatS3mg009_0395 [Acidimicrobiia bacterium]
MTARLRIPGRPARAEMTVPFVRVVDAALSVVSSAGTVSREHAEDLLFALDAIAAERDPDVRGPVFDALAAVASRPAGRPELIDLLLDLRNAVDPPRVPA